MVKQPNNRCRILRSKPERGATLIFALMLLMVLTVLGISGISNSVLEERMSGNFYHANTAFQSAETALRVAEEWLDAQVYNNLNWEGLFEVGGTGLQGLYNSKPNGAVNNQICQGQAGCGFDPTDETDWCDAAPPACPLADGFVTLGSNDLGTGALAPVGDPNDATNRVVAQQPRFIIEYIGEADVQVPLEVGQVVAPSKLAFRITAIGWGQELTIREVLQSHYLISQ
ncbi:MAG: pilus assembly protein [gamma proteobacterium endosymbiont of Lamellibrachia anaximandri]|nr:pilus assembly protein [gamma proteobacterium endosymbiont of Lamellibrachia anaximandri]MBL3617582.1 pilus assembly protein [gamma proteobacterium endosymbiont of Lamellibrachia anaximandri]